MSTDVLIFLSHARFAHELADVFEKNEKKNKTSAYRLRAHSFGRICFRITDLSRSFQANPFPDQ